MAKKTENTPASAQKKAVDWDSIHRVLEAADERLKHIDDLSDEALEKALAQRAAIIARRVDEQDLGEVMEIVVAQMGRELYGIEVQHVFDIRPVQNITRVPRVPPWVSGVVNLRGRIMSVLDLARYLNLQAAENADEQSRRLIVAETPTMELSILVDNVLSVEPVPLSMIQEATEAIRGIRAEYVKGLVIRENSNKGKRSGEKTESEMLVILDLPALLADTALVVQEA